MAWKYACSMARRGRAPSNLMIATVRFTVVVVVGSAEVASSEGSRGGAGERTRATTDASGGACAHVGAVGFRD